MLTWLQHLDRVIRGEAIRPSALRSGDIEQPVGGLAVIGIVLGALYGLCMGVFGLFQHSHTAVLQMFSTIVKVPILFFLTLAVTFPSLYVFNALVGSRLSMLSVLRVLVISLTVMLTVLASLGPIVAFFSASTTSYPFMLLLNVLVFSISGLLGLRYMRVTLQRLTTALSAPTVPQMPVDFAFAPPLAEFSEGGLPSQPPVAPPPVRALEHSAQDRQDRDVKRVFQVWMMVFGLVGGQMAWVLRPFLGNPASHFAWLRGRESNFFEGVFHALQRLFS
ncbi:MAG: hypothetical protein JWN14_3942 [Chthonomonadales bacterium]|nr:hypothetical protein [Chthonomonadales bacterium]